MFSAIWSKLTKSITLLLYNNYKLMNNNAFWSLGAAYFVKKRPIRTLIFQAEVSCLLVNYIFKVFETIDLDVLLRSTEFFSIINSFSSFISMISINKNDMPDVSDN